MCVQLFLNTPNVVETLQMGFEYFDINLFVC